MQIAVDSPVLSRRRYAGILSGAFTSFLSRGLSAAINLLPISLALPYLGTERFGAWATISTIQLWLQLADFGLAAGITTPIAKALARGDERTARKTLAAALCAISAGCLVLFGAAFLLIRTLDVTRAFQFHNIVNKVEFDNAALFAIGITLLGTPNVIITRVLQLQSRPLLANSWLLAGQLASLLAILICTREKVGVVALTGVTAAFPAASNIACMFWFFYSNPRLRPRLEPLDLSSAKRISHVGAANVAFQFVWMLLLNSSVFLAGSLISPSAAAEFSVINRLAALCTVPAQLVSVYFWTAYADAIVRAEHRWVRRAFLRHVSTSFAVTAVLAICVAVTAPLVVTRWTQGQVTVNEPLLWWSLAWQLVNAVANPAGTLLVAHDKYSVQIITGLISGVAALWLGRALCNSYGIAGIPAATTIAYLVVAAVPLLIQLKQTLSES